MNINQIRRWATWPTRWRIQHRRLNRVVGRREIDGLVVLDEKPVGEIGRGVRGGKWV